MRSPSGTDPGSGPGSPPLPGPFLPRKSAGNAYRRRIFKSFDFCLPTKSTSVPKLRASWWRSPPDGSKHWCRKFDEPIPLARGRRLVTLGDAGIYILKLPASEHTVPEWQAAMEALGLVATLGGPTMFARIGIVRALNRKVERVFNPDRKEHHWGRRKLARYR